MLLLTLSSLWGSSYTFIRVGVATIPPVTLIAARWPATAVVDEVVSETENKARYGAAVMGFALRDDQWI